MKRAVERSIFEIVENGTVEELADFLKDVERVKRYFNDQALSPLDLAVKAGNVEMVKLSLEKKADPMEFDPKLDRDNDPRKAYFEGLRSGNPEIKKLMLGVYPINAAFNDNKQTILMYCLQLGFDTEIIKLLLDNGANPNITDDQGKTSLIYALEYYQPEIVELLLKYGADPRIHDHQLKNSLHWLMKSTMNEPDIESSSDDDSEDSEQKKRFSVNMSAIAAFAEKFLELEDLRDPQNPKSLRYDINAQDINGDTPLHLAVAEGGMQAVVDVLLQKGANPNAANKRGQAPIHIAATNSDLIACKKLLEVSNVWDIDAYGNSPMLLTMQKDVQSQSDFAMQLLFLSKATTLAQVAKPNPYYKSTANIVLKPSISNDIKVVTCYTIAAVADKGALEGLFAAAAQPILPPPQIYNNHRSTMCTNLYDAFRNIPGAPKLKDAELALAKFDSEFLCTYLAHTCGITLNPIMLNWFKQEFKRNPNAAFLEQFMSVHQRIIPIQNLLNNGAILRMDRPHRHVVSMDMIVEIFMCTSNLNHQDLWLPAEIQELLIASLLQVPEEVFSWLRILNSQNTNLSKQ